MHRYRQCTPVFLYALFSQEDYTCFTECLQIFKDVLKERYAIELSYLMIPSHALNLRKLPRMNLIRMVFFSE